MPLPGYPLTLSTVWLSLPEYPRPAMSGLHLCILSHSGPSAPRVPSCLFPSWDPCVFLPPPNPPPQPPERLILVTSAIFVGSWGEVWAPPPPSASSTLSLPCYSTVSISSTDCGHFTHLAPPGQEPWLFIADFPAKEPEHTRYSVLVEWNFLTANWAGFILQ